MTNSALNSLLKDPTTDVEFNTDEQTATIKDLTKFKQTFYVFKSMDNSPWFAIKSERPIAEELGGSYSSVFSATQAVCSYLHNSKPSKATQRDTYQEERKIRNAAKSEPEGGELV